tara:strand:- start:974 stop:1411 length:438 start_codon:yes stop_codon:yes gene_type:complete
MMVNLPLKLAVIAALGVGANEVFPQAEGRIMPVVADFTITEIEPSDDAGWSIINGSMNKLRGCDFEKMRFTLHSGDGEVTVAYRFLEASKVRPANNATAFGPWEVQITQDQMDLAELRLETWHDCHAGYLTETVTDVQMKTGLEN